MTIKPKPARVKKKPAAPKNPAVKKSETAKPQASEIPGTPIITLRVYRGPDGLVRAGLTAHEPQGDRGEVARVVLLLEDWVNGMKRKLVMPDPLKERA